MTIYVGQRRRYSFDFESNDTDTDPSTVVPLVMDPDGITTEYAEVDDSGQGQFHIDVDHTKPGPWVIRAQGTGTVPAAIEYKVIVEQSPFYVET